MNSEPKREYGTHVRANTPRVSARTTYLNRNMLLELAQKKDLKLLHIGDTIESEEFDFAFFKIPVDSSVEAYENALVSVF